VSGRGVPGVHRWLWLWGGTCVRFGRELRTRAAGVDRRGCGDGTAERDAAALDAELCLTPADETGLAIQVGVVLITALALALLGAAERQQQAEQAQP
jgi:hypothetical protein